MIVPVVGAVALLAGAPLSVVAVGVAFGLWPMPSVVILVGTTVAIHLWRNRKTPFHHREAGFFRSLAGIVRAGDSLRNAIAASEHPAVTDPVKRLCVAGAPIGEIGAELEPAFPENGRAFASLCAMSEQTGSSMASALESFANQATATEDRRRRQRVSLTQARMSAWVVGVAPLALTIGMVGFRGFPEPRSPMVILPMVVGASLQIAGMAIVFVVSRRAVT